MELKNNKIKYSIFAASALFLFSGCYDKNEISKSDAIEKKAELKEVEKENILKNIETKKEVERSINIKEGDNVKTIFERLSTIDKNVYIIETGIDVTSKINVNGIKDLVDLEKFFIANNFVLTYKRIDNSNYIKVKVEQSLTSAEKKLAKTNVILNGNLPVGDVVKMISQKSNIQHVWEDKTANNVSLINKNVSYNGNGLEALKNVVGISDLNLVFKDDKAIISYFKTETMNLDLFTRDRNTNTDISIEMKSDNESSSSTSTNNGSNSSSSSTDLSVSYKSSLIKDLEASLDSVLSKQGSYTLMPTSGQIMIRDKGENVRMAQKLISDFNAQFKDTIEITLTFYKVTSEKNDKRGLDFSNIGTKFNLNASNMVSNAFLDGTRTYAASYDSSRLNTNFVLNFLKEHGDAEVMNPMTFETQSNILKTVKIANNYGYISSIKTTTTSSDAVSAEVNPSSIADGGFISAIAKSIGNDSIAIDLYSTTTSLTKFNSVTVSGNTVQTPDTSEQSIDGYHQVKAGVPYILVSHKYEESKIDKSGLPVKYLESLGYKEDNSKDVYIVIALEANIRK